MTQHSPERAEVLRQVAEAVPRPPAGAPVRVAVDGVDGAGKSGRSGSTSTPAGRRTGRAS